MPNGFNRLRHYACIAAPAASLTSPARELPAVRGWTDEAQLSNAAKGMFGSSARTTGNSSSRVDLIANLVDMLLAIVWT